jgi:hypothetical protein
MDFSSSLFPGIQTQLQKIASKVLLKMFIKTLSKPMFRKLFKLAKFTYQTLTSVKSQAKSEGNENKATEELSVVIDDLLNQLGTKFSTISEELLGKSECFLLVARFLKTISL